MTVPIIPMASPDLTGAEIKAVKHVLDTPHLSIGPQLVEFEQRFAAYVGSRYAVGVSSGTAGLHLAIIATGISEGDLVITTRLVDPLEGSLLKATSGREAPTP